MTDGFPEYINVMRLVTYDVNQICEGLIESGTDKEDITLEEVLEVIDRYVEEDFGETRGLIWQDENGNDLQ